MKDVTNHSEVAELIKAIASLMHTAIPIEIDLWDADSAAAYLKVSRRQVLEHYAVLPGFPQAILLPSGRRCGKAPKRHPRWKAREIIAWAEKHQERRVV